MTRIHLHLNIAIYLQARFVLILHHVSKYSKLLIDRELVQYVRTRY